MANVEEDLANLSLLGGEDEVLPLDQDGVLNRGWDASLRALSRRSSSSGSRWLRDAEPVGSQPFLAFGNKEKFQHRINPNPPKSGISLSSEKSIVVNSGNESWPRWDSLAVKSTMGPSVSGGHNNVDSSMFIDEEDIPIDQVEGGKRPRNLTTSPVVSHNTDSNGASLFISADLQDQVRRAS
ncbi:hypothetical protein V6N13_122473 [Hibiscus sabdariffa]